VPKAIEKFTKVWRYHKSLRIIRQT
jgi:hypothetical protein